MRIAQMIRYIDHYCIGFHKPVQYPCSSHGGSHFHQHLLNSFVGLAENPAGTSWLYRWSRRWYTGARAEGQLADGREYWSRITQMPTMRNLSTRLFFLLKRSSLYVQGLIRFGPAR